MLALNASLLPDTRLKFKFWFAGNSNPTEKSICPFQTLLWTVDTVKTLDDADPAEKVTEGDAP